MSTATSSARRSACSRSAARGSRAPGRRPAGRSICRAWSPSRRRARSTASRARSPRSAPSASISTGSARPAIATEAERCVGLMARSPLGARVELKGPVGERNVYALRPRGRIAAVAASQSAALIQIGAILATGNDAVVDAAAKRWRSKRLPPELAHRIIDGLLPAGSARARRRPVRGRSRRARRGLAPARRPPRPDRAPPGAVTPAASPPARTTTSPISSRNARSPPTPRRPAAMRA